MKELRDIVRAWNSAKPGSKMVLVTVIDIKGSAYRRPGAHLFIVDDLAFGSISGGCLESDLISTAWDRTAEGPATAVFDTTSDEDAMFGYGLGCRGIVSVFLRRVAREDAQMEQFETHLQGRSTTILATQVESGKVSLVAAGQIVTGFNPPMFVEVIEPVVALHVYGAGFDAAPLARIAAELGWSVNVYDQRSALLTSDRFEGAITLNNIRYEELKPVPDPCAAHVVMTHNFAHDLEVLKQILPSDPSYLGVLGPRLRTERLLQQIGESSRLSSVRSPIGLDIGAETPQEIALAIAAEIQAVFRERTAGFLKDRPKRIHREVVAS